MRTANIQEIQAELRELIEQHNSALSLLTIEERLEHEAVRRKYSRLASNHRAFSDRLSLLSQKIEEIEESQKTLEPYRSVDASGELSQKIDEALLVSLSLDEGIADRD